MLCRKKKPSITFLIKIVLTSVNIDFSVCLHPLNQNVFPFIFCCKRISSLFISSFVLKNVVPKHELVIVIIDELIQYQRNFKVIYYLYAGKKNNN